MRAPPGELNADRPPPSPIVVAPGLNQLPTDAVGIKVVNHRCGSRAAKSTILAEGNARNLCKTASGGKASEHASARLFTFAPDDDVKLRFLRQDLAPMIGWVDAAIDQDGVRQSRAQPPAHSGNDRVRSGRAAMPKEDGIGRERNRLFQEPFLGTRRQFSINQPHFMAVIQKRSPNRQQTQRRQVIGDAAADRGVRDIQQQNSHIQHLVNSASLNAFLNKPSVWETRCIRCLPSRCVPPVHQTEARPEADKAEARSKRNQTIAVMVLMAFDARIGSDCVWRPHGAGAQTIRLIVADELAFAQVELEVPFQFAADVRRQADAHGTVHDFGIRHRWPA